LDNYDEAHRIALAVKRKLDEKREVTE